MKETLIAIGIIVSVTIIGWSAISGMDKSEVVECNKWQSQAVEYSGFYLTHWQADQCRAHNITINAPIK